MKPTFVLCIAGLWSFSANTATTAAAEAPRKPNILVIFADDLDGVNLLPYLAGENIGVPHEALYWRFGPQKAIRKGRWKLVDWRDFEAKT